MSGGSQGAGLGRRGEWIALFWFLAHGYRLRHRNWRGGGGEIDLVFSRKDVIVFVEVKSRSSRDFGGALAAVDARKQRILTRAAAAYLSRHELWGASARFDVLGIERRRRAVWPFDIQHVIDAFHVDSEIMAG